MTPREPPVGTGDLTATTLVAPGKDTALVARLLRRAEIAHVPANDAAHLRERILAGCGPVVVAVESVASEAGALVRSLQTQPNWSDIPVILFAHQHGALPPSLRPLIERSNTTMLRRPVQAVTFLSVMRSAVTDRQRQYAVRDLLLSLEQLNRRNRRRIVQLQRLAAQLTRAEERERRRLAGVLHDDLQQLLVGAQYRVSIMDRRVRQGRDLTGPLADLATQLSEAIAQSRSLSHELTPPPLRRRGLGEALRWLARRMESLFDLEVALEGDRELDLGSEDLETFSYRAVQELLFNVVKHAGAGEAVVSLRAGEDRVTITVGDQGRGFAQPTESGGDQAEAGGLGLFSIGERAELFGGRLAVDSAPGAGTRITLEIPRRPAAHTRSLAGSDGSGPGSSRSDGDGDGAGQGEHLRVVIVDDHETLREGVKALLLEEPDLAVVGEAADGQQALDLVRRREPDVVLLDVAMPGMDGLEAASRLRERHPALRIIGLSTFSHEDMGERMLEAGADLYLCKSDPGTDLVAAIRQGPSGDGDRRGA